RTRSSAPSACSPAGSPGIPGHRAPPSVSAPAAGPQPRADRLPAAMSPRFDSVTRVLELAVADLLEPQLLRSIGFGNRGGFERMWLGQAIHGRYQEEALASDGSYRREVSLR